MTYQPIYEEKYIPDMSVWSSLGTMPFYSSRIMKINNILYAFGCAETALTGKIYSTAWNDPTGWTYAGITVDGLGSGTAIGIIGDNIYSWGQTTVPSGNNILTASINNPLEWTDTTADWTSHRDNTALIITPNYICMYAGHNGNAAGNVSYALTSAPTSFTTGGSIGGWQNTGCYLDGIDVHIFGGQLNTSRIWSFMKDSPTKLTFSATTPAYSIDACAAVFHVENKVYVTGIGNSNLYYANTNNMHIPWDIYTAVMPGNITYPYSNWIGPDGYAYLINVDKALYRSSRKKIYVVDPPASNGTYTNRYAVTETGGSSMYTVHCQMGMAPWHTNRRDKF